MWNVLSTDARDKSRCQDNRVYILRRNIVDVKERARLVCLPAHEKCYNKDCYRALLIWNTLIGFLMSCWWHGFERKHSCSFKCPVRFPSWEASRWELLVFSFLRQEKKMLFMLIYICSIVPISINGVCGQKICFLNVIWFVWIKRNTLIESTQEWTCFA